MTSFVGRETEVKEIAGLLIRNRLATLVGPGGAGKTRLAIEAADRLAEDVRDGVWLVELASVVEPAGVPPYGCQGQRSCDRGERRPSWYRRGPRRGIRRVSALRWRVGNASDGASRQGHRCQVGTPDRLGVTRRGRRGRCPTRSG